MTLVCTRACILQPARAKGRVLMLLISLVGKLLIVVAMCFVSELGVESRVLSCGMVAYFKSWNTEIKLRALAFCLFVFFNAKLFQ